MSRYAEDCQRMINGWWRNNSPKVYEFPRGKTIIICCNDDIALLGKVYRACPYFENTTLRTRILKDHHKKKIDELARFGVDADSQIWLDELNYICCKFIKVVRGMEEDTFISIPSMEEGAEVKDISKFTRPDQFTHFNHPVKKGGR